MSKKRRTRKEKMSATPNRDYSAVLQLPSLKPLTIATKDLPPIDTNTTSTTYTHKSHTYVARDIRQTITITTILIALNVALFMVLKIRLINLFGIVF